MEKQKRRLTGFIKKIALKDSVYKQIQVMTDADRKQMAMVFLEVSLHAAQKHICLVSLVCFACTLH